MAILFRSPKEQRLRRVEFIRQLRLNGAPARVLQRCWGAEELRVRQDLWNRRGGLAKATLCINGEPAWDALAWTRYADVTRVR